MLIAKSSHFFCMSALPQSAGVPILAGAMSRYCVHVPENTWHS